MSIATFCIVFLSLTLSLCNSASAQTDRRRQPSEALLSTNWQSMKSAHFPIEALITDPTGWVGLNHLFGTGEHMQSRWRTALPFLAPTVIQSFPGRSSFAVISNPIPVFYLHATESASLYPTFDPGEVRLLRLQVKGDHRELPVSKGVTTFTFAATPPDRFFVAVSVKRLSQTVIELRPRNPLTSGQYLITLGDQENDGFEFQIKCSQ